MTLDDLRGLDINDIGRWPGVAQIVAILLVCAALGFAGYWFVIKNQVQQLETVRKDEQDLRRQFEVRQKKAASLEDYKAQLAEMEERFSFMLRQLPGKKEVASLLQDVSQVRVSSGLEEKLFQPQNEVKRDFYAELPIKIELQGDFHHYGIFTEGVGSLPRIVTLHDIKLTQSKSSRGQRAAGRLQMNATAKTYRYLEEGE